jgi:hypothetical protein
MTESAPTHLSEFRHGLYSRAYDALLSGAGANALLRLYAQALGCSRAAEGVELAGYHVDNGYPKVGAEHLPARSGGCPDCARAACLAIELERCRAVAVAVAGSRRGSSAA